MPFIDFLTEAKLFDARDYRKAVKGLSHFRQLESMSDESNANRTHLPHCIQFELGDDRCLRLSLFR